MPYTTLTPTQQHRTWVAIDLYGGGFCRRLAAAWFAADSSHRERLNAAFPDLLTKYGPGSGFYRDEAL